MTDENRKTVYILYEDFKEYLRDDDNKFKKYVEEGDENELIEIEYWYYDTGSEEVGGIKWKIPDTKVVYTERFRNSSLFALWWCNISEGEED